MIAEFIQHFLHPAPKHIKGLGLLKEAIGIESRYSRCKSAWQTHLDNCHDLLSRYRNKKKITLLGAGSLHDVPIEILLNNAQQIELVDIAFLRPARNLAANHSQITLIENDVTDGLKSLWQHYKNGLSSHNFKTPIANLSAYKGSDLIVSLNILSQLALPFERHLKPRKAGIAEMIMLHHIQALKSLEKPVLLIADIAHHYHHADGSISSETSLPEKFKDAPIKTWTWDIAPKGEYDRNIAIHHTVGAWQFNHD